MGISAPGCISVDKRIQIQPSKPETVSIGEVSPLIRQVEKPEVRAENISPAQVTLALLSASGSF